GGAVTLRPPLKSPGVVQITGTAPEFRERPVVMPIYEYRCGDCGHTLDALQKLSDDLLKDCPECEQPSLKRLMSAPAFRLKGGGWYETDFKSDKEKKRNLAEGGDKGGDKSESKSSTDSAGDKKSEKKETKAKDSGTSAAIA